MNRWYPFLLAALILIADRITKIYIKMNFSAWDSLSVIPGFFRIVHAENPGAAFGILADHDGPLRSIILIGVSSVVLLFVIFSLLSRASAFTSTAARVGLALILGGAVGNVYDRVVHGTVTDFIELYYGTWSFPAFNIADSAITIGSIFLLFDLLRPGPKQVGKPSALTGRLTE